MRLGIKTDDVFLVELNEKNQQIQNLFLGKIKKITKNYSIDVMIQDGTIKKQQTNSTGMQRMPWGRPKK